MAVDQAKTPAKVAMRVSAVRFGADLWRLLEEEAELVGVSVAQYVREAALARASAAAAARGEDPLKLLAGAARNASRRSANDASNSEAYDTPAEVIGGRVNDARSGAQALVAQSEQAARAGVEPAANGRSADSSRSEAAGSAARTTARSSSRQDESALITGMVEAELSVEEALKRHDSLVCSFSRPSAPRLVRSVASARS